ncbi:translation initiation factor SUI1 domain-containing protein, putative [Eimeria necatrix]|uniref:Translation initiation factor SUI1 domain-containing protein, putative n=1 Tax=Eimeria necatrix TaxID=51315 RepID=U6N2I4_9EIME|nr:translation initiation factor SUI1 domain-containing protein, putative [Eimeria necatrix]CDJ68135.1 translation initiation factor SUI1 domain-containing protein, putative [Eimeria necatrix]
MNSSNGHNSVGRIDGGDTNGQSMKRMPENELTSNQDDSEAADASSNPPAVGQHAGSETSSSCWEHDRQPPMTGPRKVEYCPTCGMPFEYCEFSGAACSKQKKDGKDPTQASVVQQNEHEQQLTDELQEKTAITEAKRGGAKKDGAKPKVVTVQKQAKRRGKCSTCVWGLEHFGVKQEQAAKLASKHFACGASFQKGQPGQMPFVEIQGDVEETIAAFLDKNFDIPGDKIVFLAEK